MRPRHDWLAINLDHGQKAGDALCRLSALLDPRSGLLAINLDAFGAVFRLARIIGAKFLDETAIAWGAAVCHDNTIERTFFRSATGESDFEGHGSLLDVRRLCDWGWGDHS